MKQTYRHKRTSVFLINYHFVWIPRRRRPVLVGKVRSRLDELLREKSNELKCDILALEILSDHLHLFISAPPELAPLQIVHRLKGYSSRVLREEFPFLLKLPSMWTRSYFVSTAGNVSSEMIRRYIEEQTKQD